MNKRVLTKISKFFVGHRKVAAVYFYGSRAKGAAVEKSDLDLAVLFHNPLKDSGRVLKMGVELQKLLGNTVSVDLREVHLDLSPVFLREVISQGKVIFCRDEEARVEFEVKAMRIIDDSEKIRRINLYYLKKSFREDAYGKTL